MLIDIKHKAWLALATSTLVGDRGNFVSDRIGNVVISKKFLANNRLAQAEARKEVLAMMGIFQVVPIEAAEQGGLKHADRVVSL